MATLDENIRKIRSEAIYGTDVREAIAAGIEGINSEVKAAKLIVDGREIYVNLTKISGSDDDYIMEIVNPT